VVDPFIARAEEIEGGGISAGCVLRRHRRVKIAGNVMKRRAVVRPVVI